MSQIVEKCPISQC